MKSKALRYFFCLALPVSIGACGDTKADKVQKQVGRFASVAAQEGYPPLVIDTATGCVMAVSKDDHDSVTVDEVNFPDGTTSCRVMKYLLVDTSD
jgi:hypothetical protein